MADESAKNLPLPDLLLGTYEPKLDSKGRVAIPAKMRTQLGAGCVMARGQERCVYLLPNDEFRRIAQQIQQVSLSNRAARNYLRVFLSGAVVLEPDKQGRVMIPQMLRSYANLADDVVLIGVGTRAELWNREDWETYLHDQEEDYSTMSDDILPVAPLMGGGTDGAAGMGVMPW
ncbi:division/cell wall cluster transcriptional repressor MraZ [Alloscardovia macacae]|uniref:Transcriptional regulator MraZ n=1 Tax=Alloscardovia macacae TaxID=1160091 RepID=A0A261F5K1_9BIFI|nr:division/cell wall cluster transcriptional repressor MraZ [Alloscardovia macacae]OZG54417.1 protein MraZ [Alloscardovia macacae]